MTRLFTLPSKRCTNPCSWFPYCKPNLALRHTLFIHYHHRGICTVLLAFILFARRCSITSGFAQHASLQYVWGSYHLTLIHSIQSNYVTGCCTAWQTLHLRLQLALCVSSFHDASFRCDNVALVLYMAEGHVILCTWACFSNKGSHSWTKFKIMWSTNQILAANGRFFHKKSDLCVSEVKVEDAFMG